MIQCRFAQRVEQWILQVDLIISGKSKELFSENEYFYPDMQHFVRATYPCFGSNSPITETSYSRTSVPVALHTKSDIIVKLPISDCSVH